MLYCYSYFSQEIVESTRPYTHGLTSIRNLYTLFAGGVASLMSHYHHVLRCRCGHKIAISIIGIVSQGTFFETDRATLCPSLCLGVTSHHICILYNKETSWCIVLYPVDKFVFAFIYLFFYF